MKTDSASLIDKWVERQVKLRDTFLWLFFTNTQALAYHNAVIQYVS